MITSQLLVPNSPLKKWYPHEKGMPCAASPPLSSGDWAIAGKPPLAPPHTGFPSYACVVHDGGSRFTFRPGTRVVDAYRAVGQFRLQRTHLRIGKLTTPQEADKSEVGQTV